MYTNSKSAQCILQIPYNFVNYTSIKLKKKKNYGKWVKKKHNKRRREGREVYEGREGGRAKVAKC